MKLAIFTLAEKEYGVDIKDIKEVIRMRKITPVPDAAAYVEGVMSLRGRVVPLINLRKKLGLEKKDMMLLNRIIVTDIKGKSVGVIVDGVTDVMTVGSESVTPPDEVLKGAGYLTGVARIGKRLILLVDIGKLLAGDAAKSIEKVHSRVEVRRKD